MHRKSEGRRRPRAGLAQWLGVRLGGRSEPGGTQFNSPLARSVHIQEGLDSSFCKAAFVSIYVILALLLYIALHFANLGGQVLLLFM